MDSLSMSFKTFQGTVDVTQCLQCSPVSLDMINHLSKAPWISWTPYFQDLKGVFCFLLELILILSNKALLVLLVSVSVSFKEMINRPISEVYEMELGNSVSFRENKGDLEIWWWQKHTELIQPLWNKPQKTCPTALITLQKLCSFSLDSVNCLVSEKTKCEANPHCWAIQDSFRSFFPSRYLINGIRTVTWENPFLISRAAELSYYWIHNSCLSHCPHSPSHYQVNSSQSILWLKTHT